MNSVTLPVLLRILAEKEVIRAGRVLNKHYFILGLFSVALATGCTSPSPRESFENIQSTVSERLGHEIAWRGASAADAEVDEQIRVLLAQPLTVHAAVQVALLGNHTLQATYEELGLAQADLVEAGLLRNPVFAAQYRVPGRPDNPWELSVVHDFIDVLFIPLRRRMAAAELEAAKARVAGVVLDHTATTQRAFYSLQAAEQLVLVRKAVLDAYEASALLAQAQLDAGNISDLTLAEEQVRFEQSKMDLALAESDAAQQREVLNNALGLRGADARRWTVAPDLPETPSEDPPAENLESLALARRMDLQAVAHEIDALAQSQGLTRSSALVASVNVGAHVQRGPDVPSTWGPSVEFPVPLFNQGQARVARAAAKLRQRQQQYLALAAAIQSEVRSAANRMLSAKKVAEHHRSVILPLQAKIVEESQLHYHAMQIGPAELLQAKRAQLEAGGNYVNVRKAYWLARVDLERAVGGRLETSPKTTEEQEAGHTSTDKQRATHGEH